MTENEAKAIRWIRNIKNDTIIVKEEILDNEAICCNILSHTIRKEININAEIIIKAISELDKYRAIGTVEECREARERRRAKKVNNRTPLRDLNGSPYAVRGSCPNCGVIGLLSTNIEYCHICGQKLDWSE